ncbi:MAG: GTPase [Candidatus Gastranaerophilaceae bacterium]
MVFIDTPGIHKPLDKLGEYLMDEAKYSIPDADLILFIVDVSEPAGAGDKWIVEKCFERNKDTCDYCVKQSNKLKDPTKKAEPFNLQNAF